MLPTLAEILELDAVRRGSPRVLAAADRLDRPVRWVHAIEVADAARLLHGGELVLTTGIALPDEPSLQARYVAELTAVGVAGLAVELGRRYAASLPPPLVAAAAEQHLPLIAFAREVLFVEVTEAVHARIIDSQSEELRAAARLHEAFTELSVAGASAAEIVSEAARLAGRPVILADLAHAVLACEPAGRDAAQLLDGFAARARLIGPVAGTIFDATSGWLVTPAGARGENWGRVILACQGPPAPLDTVLIERTAAALALTRLIARQRESLERQVHRTLISAILEQAGADPDEAAVRARALGVPVDGRQLIAVVVRLRDPGPGLSAQARVLTVADAVADACRAERVPAIVGSLDDARAGALLSLDRRASADQALTAVCGRVRQLLGRRADRPASPLAGRPPESQAARRQAARRRASPDDGQVIAAGSAAGSIRDARRSFLEAQQVADAAAANPDAFGHPAAGSHPGSSPSLAGPAARPYYRLADLRLRGLLQLLRGDSRVAGFAEREIGALLAYDASHGTALTSVLAAYLEAGGNKAEAAHRAHLARPTLYERLRHIERVLGVSLDSAQSRTSLHVALLALEAARPAAGGAGG
ncbi:MAG TPA: PucR family transcriptional regulator [Streptosporangiaceae bacterium]|nr:PucR family transcriptional regulator [Streptosporangiaceae bacterium]